MKKQTALAVFKRPSISINGECFVPDNNGGVGDGTNGRAIVPESASGENLTIPEP